MQADRQQLLAAPRDREVRAGERRIAVRNETADVHWCPACTRYWFRLPPSRRERLVWVAPGERKSGDVERTCPDCEA